MGQDDCTDSDVCANSLTPFPCCSKANLALPPWPTREKLKCGDQATSTLAPSCGPSDSLCSTHQLIINHRWRQRQKRFITLYQKIVHCGLAVFPPKRRGWHNLELLTTRSCVRNGPAKPLETQQRHYTGRQFSLQAQSCHLKRPGGTAVPCECPLCRLWVFVTFF